MTENKKHYGTPEWGHKILRVVSDEHLIGSALPVQPKNINHIKMDDLEYEHESLNFEGWRYQLGFALDDDSFYLFYKKPINLTK